MPSSTAEGATLTNKISATASETDQDPADNTDITATTTVIRQADIAVIKLDSPDPVVAGDDLTYTVSVTNNGPSDATGVTLAGTLLAAVTFTSSTPGAPACTESSGTVTCNLGELVASTSTTVTIVTTVSQTTAATITNAAGVMATEADPDMSNNTAAEDTLVIAPSVSRADLAVMLFSSRVKRDSRLLAGPVHGTHGNPLQCEIAFVVDGW